MNRLPDRQQILDWLRANPGAAGRRDLARAFGLKGADRAALRDLLHDMRVEGSVGGDRRRVRATGDLPPVAVLVVGAPDAAGDLLARPQHWEGEGPAPVIELRSANGVPAPGPGDRVLARIARSDAEEGPRWRGEVIRRLSAGPSRLLGIFRKGERGDRIEPIAKGGQTTFAVAPGDAFHARDGELVEAEALGRPGFGLAKARVLARLGDPGAARAVSLIAIHEHGLPTVFPGEALAEATAARPTGPEGRTDLRHLPLVTIDPSDARDHDDAVCALPDPGVAEGWIVWVAIADVAHYVRPGSALDREAGSRGNSAYFPDRVVPMLPEALSADLCSLRAGEGRPCIAAELRLAPDGRVRAHRFVRGFMRSRAFLTYEAVQAAADGRATGGAGAVPDDLAPALRDLYAAYAAAARARDRRQPLDLDLPERRIVLSETGEVLSVGFRERLAAHRLIEEFMILANVAAAETLEARRSPLVYRVHEEPGREKVETLREIVEGCGLALAKGQVLKTAQFNRLLAEASGTDFAEMVHLAVLRTQTQAYYAPQNLGHFGLNLRAYAHFTSPIRRYADLIVHRALIAAHGWGTDGLRPQEAEALEATATHISMTERRAMAAERDTTDRYLAAFLAARVGAEFAGRVAGVARFGLFVKLDETGADGLIPIGTLGREYFHYDAGTQTLTGEQTRRVIGLGMPVTVRLVEAVPVTGGLLFELLDVAGSASPKGQVRRGPVRRRPGPARHRHR